MKTLYTKTKVNSKKLNTTNQDKTQNNKNTAMVENNQSTVSTAKRLASLF